MGRKRKPTAFNDLEPGEVLAWWARHPSARPWDVVDHFCPGAPDADRKTLHSRFRAWKRLAKKRGELHVLPAPVPAATARQAPARTAYASRPVPSADPEFAALPYGKQVAQLVAETKGALDQARSESLRAVPPLTKQLVDLLEKLRAIRAEQSDADALPEDPVELARWIMAQLGEDNVVELFASVGGS